MTRWRWFLGVVGAGAFVCAVAGAVACGPRLSSHSSEVLDRLGKATGFSGTDCASAQSMVDAYLDEIGRRPSRPLSLAVPSFARRAISTCPQSRPTVRVNGNVDASTVRGIIGGPASDAGGPIALENWLRADVDQGKIVSLTLDLAKLPR